MHNQDFDENENDNDNAFISSCSSILLE